MKLSLRHRFVQENEDTLPHGPRSETRLYMVQREPVKSV